MSNGAINIEDRPDYMLEAFLDEQHILVKPLLVRRFSLLAMLEFKAQQIEAKLKKAAAKETQLLTNELLAIAEEKILVTKQIQDLAYKQMDTLIDVENALEATARKERDEAESKPIGETGASAKRQQHREKSAATNTSVDDELWCICRKADDGRAMVACDNESKCPYFWWHLDCVERQIAMKGVGYLPEENMKWFCPVCEAANSRKYINSR
jgi:hypothetical protein